MKLLVSSVSRVVTCLVLGWVLPTLMTCVLCVSCVMALGSRL